MRALECILVGLLLTAGMILLTDVFLLKDRSFSGRSVMRKLYPDKKNKRERQFSPGLRKLLMKTGQYVILNDSAEESLERNLARAGINLSAREYTALKYLMVASGIAMILLCAVIEFYVGVLLVVLLTLFGYAKVQEMLADKLKKKDEAIALEMPRFIRTIARNLRSNRDILSVLNSYRSVAGEELGGELDTLMMHMRSGNTASALQQFQKSVGSEEAFRLCSILLEIERGIDQTASLDYLADDMAAEAKRNIQKTLALRPGQMRRTYYPAVGVCIAMILYVLVVFVMDQLNNLF